MLNSFRAVPPLRSSMEESQLEHSAKHHREQVGPQEAECMTYYGSIDKPHSFRAVPPSLPSMEETQHEHHEKHHREQVGPQEADGAPDRPPATD